MGVKTRAEDYRVVVYPRRLGDFGMGSVSDRLVSRDEQDRQRQYKDRCEEIASQVRRHADNVGSVSIECETILECEFCGSVWTENGTTYNGGCCGKDEENAPKETPNGNP